MRSTTLWPRMLGVEKTVVEDIELDEATGVLIASVRPTASMRHRCGSCLRRCARYDAGHRRRRWRSLDAGTTVVYLEADAPRVSCPVHGVIVAAVPWARHQAGHTHHFDAQVAWLVTQTSKSATSELMRITWRTVGAIITRVWDDTTKTYDQFADLSRIGIDEISYKRGHKYLTVVVDHTSGRLVWAAPGRDQATLETFFDALGAERSAQITHVSADAAGWISRTVAARCPNAVRCADAFHVVSWASEALDETRRAARMAARAAPGGTIKAGRSHGLPRRDSVGPAKAIHHARYALWKNPENLTEKQQVKLDWVEKTNPRLYRAYLLKEGLRTVFQLPYQEAVEALDVWTGWARRCRIGSFVALQRRIVRHRDSILAAIEHGLSNGRIESVNTKIRLITRVAYGFRSPEALISLAMLRLGGHSPALPGRK